MQPDFLFHANMVEKKEQIMIMEVKTCKVLDEKPFDWDLGKLCMYVYKEETQYCEAVYLIFGQKESKINNLLKGFCSSYGMMLDSVWQHIRFILVSIDENDRLKPEVYKLIKCQQKLI